MTAAGAQIAGSTAAADAARDWQSVRGDADIQYAPLPPMKPPKDPEWLKSFGEFLKAIGEWLGNLLRPLAEAIGVSWPVLKTVLIALLVLAVLFLIWRLVQPLLERWRADAPPEAPEWAPDRAAAVALLEDADRLAAEGRYGEAVHLLLRRSVHHIAEARPEWLLPASTAREIAVFPMLPEPARRAFSAIATRVERSLFALRDLDAADWREARSAYADFALAELTA